MSEHACIKFTQHLPDRRTLNPKKVRHKGRPYVKARICRAEQKLHFARREARMVERRREPVELFPVLLVHEVAHLLPQRCPRIRREDLELRERRSELDRIVDGLGDGVPAVLQKPEYIKRGGLDAETAAEA